MNQHQSSNPMDEDEETIKRPDDIETGMKEDEDEEEQDREDKDRAASEPSSDE